LEKGTADAHLFGSGEEAEFGDGGAVVGRGDGDEPIGAIEAPEALEIVAADDATHAEAQEVEALARIKGAIDEIGELSGQNVKGRFAIGRHHIEAIHLEATGFEERLEFFKDRFGVPHAMGEDDRIGLAHNHSGKVWLG
jgi:hypothetical protein